jgi:uroporphyrin-III C-methyltransferase
MVDKAKVCFVSAGLGDPDQLTRKAERLLRTASAILHDPFVSAQVLCLVNSEARVIALPSAQSTAGPSQEELYADVCGWYLRLREECPVVVRLTAEDPLLGGEASEELDFLARHGFEIEVLPGVLAETVYECRAAVREAQTAASSSVVLAEKDTGKALTP